MIEKNDQNMSKNLLYPFRYLFLNEWLSVAAISIGRNFSTIQGHLNELDVVYALGAEEAVAEGLDAKPLGQDQGTEPAKLKQIL